jgi:threonine aldolase
METKKQKNKMIDLRSDTVTKPTPEMLEYMIQAEVGDDVFAEDPTVIKFEEKVADLFGKESGLFVPSGTMSNQLGVKVLTNPGEEIIIDHKGHIYNYETGGASFLSGVQINPVHGRSGKLGVDDIKNSLRGTYDWEPLTTVLCLENTTNKGGGVCYSRDELRALKSFADENNLKVHLDGARIWNAMIRSEIEPQYFGEIADTISVCFSKGLGAPVGSMLLSSKMNIIKARRFRKMWGGGMRQVGLLAAAADFALQNNFSKLVEDHQKAQELAKVISECSKLSIDLDTVETNIVIFDVLEENASSALKKLEDKGVRMVQFGPNTIRCTFHYQITNDELDLVNKTLRELFG